MNKSDYIFEVDKLTFSSAGFDIKGIEASLISIIRSSIEKGQIVILKSFFEKEEMQAFRKQAHDFMCKSESSNPFFCSSTPNFYRRDNDPPQSAVKRNKQFLTSFYWNDDHFGEKKYYQVLSKLRNIIAGLPEEYTLSGPEDDGYVTYPSIVHYPPNGGKLNKHTDPPNKQFCTIMASMSLIGDDFFEGGLYVYYKGIKYMIDPFLEVGDVYLMNPYSIHGVDVIDPSDEDINWLSPKGRWILFPALIEAASLNGKKLEGLKDLGR